MPSNLMPPPGEGKKPGGLVIAVGVGKDKPGASSEDPAAGKAKASAEQAHVVRNNEHCKDCVHYQGESGECEKVDGTFDPEDSCVRYFEAAGGGEKEPDADEAGGMPDQDADDQQQGFSGKGY